MMYYVIVILLSHTFIIVYLCNILYCNFKDICCIGIGQPIKRSRCYFTTCSFLQTNKNCKKSDI